MISLQILQAYAKGLGEKKWTVVGARLDEGALTILCTNAEHAARLLTCCLFLISEIEGKKERHDRLSECSLQKYQHQSLRRWCFEVFERANMRMIVLLCSGTCVELRVPFAYNTVRFPYEAALSFCSSSIHSSLTSTSIASCTRRPRVVCRNLYRSASMLE
jgi:hypothetical protein